MHRMIDSFTDRHPNVQHAKSRLGSGYLKGVIIDIIFDHFLSKHWSQFIRLEFEQFISNFYRAAAQQQTTLPANGEAFIRRVIHYDFFHLYHDFANLAHVLDKLNHRLSPKLRRKESAIDYLPALSEHYTALEDDFLHFFPVLVQQFIAHSRATPDEHYFIGLSR